MALPKTKRVTTFWENQQLEPPKSQTEEDRERLIDLLEQWDEEDKKLGPGSIEDWKSFRRMMNEDSLRGYAIFSDPDR